MNDKSKTVSNRSEELLAKLSQKYSRLRPSDTSSAPTSTDLYSSDSTKTERNEHINRLNEWTHNTKASLDARLTDLQTLKETIQANNENRLKSLTPNPESTTTCKKVQAHELLIEYEITPQLDYSLYHIGIPQVPYLSITNLGNENCQNLLVEIKLIPEEYGGKWMASIPRLLLGNTWKQQDISLPLHNERFRKIIERENLQLSITVKDKEEDLRTISEPAHAMAYNEWNAELPVTLAAFVQSNDPSLNPVIEKASEYLEQMTGATAFSGYQSQNSEYVLNMIHAIHASLVHDFELTYINPPPSFEHSGQKIRLVADILMQKRGTCLDLAVMQAALWEHIGLNPCIVLIQGHAMLACWLADQHFNHLAEQFSRHDERSHSALTALLESNNLVIFNSTEIAQQAPLSESMKQGKKLLNEALESGGRVTFIDIQTCRKVGILPLP